MPPRKRRPYGSGSVTKRPDGKWLGRLDAGYTVSGKRRRISVVAKTEAECKRRLRDKRLELEREGPGAITTTRPNLKAWSETWLPMYERKARPKSYATDASIVGKWIVPTIGHRKLADLTPGDVRKMTDAIREAGRSTTTAAYAQAVLMRMLRAAIKEGHRVPERVLLTDKPAAEVSTRGDIPLEDALKILSVASKRDDAPRWACALLQGMRQAEALGLTWEAVDLDAATVDISWQLQALPYKDRERGLFRVPDGYEAHHLVDAYHLTRPKSKKGKRVVPLLPEMVDALTRWKAQQETSPHGLVFPKPNGRPQNHKDDRAAWYEIQQQAKVSRDGKRYLLHEARHTTATLLLVAGVDPEVIKAILGHSSIVTSRGYQHVDIALQRQALEKVHALLIGA